MAPSSDQPTTIGRRPFVGRLASALSLGMSSFASASPIPKDETVPVLIVGAGLAGLSAAQRLTQAGLPFRIIEARDRLGGRIWTQTIGPGPPVDLGAGWILGERNNPLVPLAQNAGATFFPADGDMLDVFDAGGKPRDVDGTIALFDRFEQWADEASRNSLDRFQADRPRSVEDHVNSWLSGAEWNAGERRDFLLAVRLEIENRYATDIGDLDLSVFAWERGDAGRDLALTKGMNALTAELARGIDVQTGIAVRGIDYSNVPITVDTNQGVIQADRVLITVPLGVLKANAIRFQPRLPEDKLRAIGQIGMGRLEKTVLHFDEPFWPTTSQSLIFTDPKAHWAEIDNLFPMTGQPVLVGRRSGGRAKDDESQSDDQMVDTMLTQLRAHFGSAVKPPAASHVTRWGTDPFSMGSASYRRVGSTPNDHELLARPLRSTLHFAGEATSRDFPGTMRGAFESGRRAADEILRQA